MERVILIADSNTGRGRLLAQRCEAAEITCKLAPHGAAALEMALVDKPRLVVAELGLPLVDALKLAEILRANPRTRGARFLFLSDEEQTSDRIRVGDKLVAASLAPEVVVEQIEQLLCKLDSIDTVAEASGAGGAVEGDLAELTLVDLLQLFHVNQRSGRVQLTPVANGAENESSQGSVTLCEGDVIRAEVGTAEGEKALFRMLSWRQGRFEFEPGAADETPSIYAPTRVLLAEGLRQLEEWDRLAPRLPPLDSPIKLRVKSSELPNIVHPLTQEVLLLLELYSRVRDVVDHCSFPDYQVLRTLHTLVEREIIELGRVPIPGPSRVSEGLFNEAQARRLREWLREESPRDGEIPDAKLLVVPADPAAMVDFANLLRSVPRVTVEAGDRSRFSSSAGVLTSVGQVDLDGEVGIEIFHLPPSERYSPLWPVAGHGAVAVLFLLSGSVGESLAQVQAMSELLRELPRSRIFHVALLPKGERISPDELRDNLSLIDDTSLFLLPLETGKPPDELLRSLFARVVP